MIHETKEESMSEEHIMGQLKEDVASRQATKQIEKVNNHTLTYRFEASLRDAMESLDKTEVEPEMAGYKERALEMLSAISGFWTEDGTTREQSDLLRKAGLMPPLAGNSHTLPDGRAIKEVAPGVWVEA